MQQLDNLTPACLLLAMMVARCQLLALMYRSSKEVVYFFLFFKTLPEASQQTQPELGFAYFPELITDKGYRFTQIV